MKISNVTRQDELDFCRQWNCVSARSIIHKKNKFANGVVESESFTVRLRLILLCDRKKVLADCQHSREIISIQVP